MTHNKSFDESLREMIKQYISENLTVSVISDAYETGGARSVQVILTLDGEDISSSTDWF